MQRTLEIMQQLGKEFRDEWQTYNAEAALAAGSPQLQRSGDGSGSMQRRRQVAQATAVGETSAGATPIVGDIFDDAMRPGASVTLQGRLADWAVVDVALWRLLGGANHMLCYSAAVSAKKRCLLVICTPCNP